MDVRGASPTDAAAVADLLRVLGYPCAEHEVVAEIELAAADTRRGILVAVEDSVIVGFVAYDHWRAFAAHDWMCKLTAIAVRPDRRDGGVGRALVQAVEQEADRQGASAVELSSGRRPERASAHSFYPALGYRDRCSEHAFYIRWLRERPVRRA